jgi:ribosomal protein S18 acetylase RimI-like enzyme
LIIRLDETPVGRLYIAKLETEIRIIDITILPEHRSAGIGTPIIQELMNEAKIIAKPLSIYVESFNRSLGLFERLGFVKTAESGYSHLLEWPRRETEDRRPPTADPVVRRPSSVVPTDKPD